MLAISLLYYRICGGSPDHYTILESSPTREHFFKDPTSEVSEKIRYGNKNEGDSRGATVAWTYVLRRLAISSEILLWKE